MVKGKIISSYLYRNNVFHYMIQDDTGKVNRYTYFGNDTIGLDTSKIINFEFETRHSDQYGPSYIINANSIKYGDIITDPKIISDFLVKHLDVNRGDALTIVSKFQDKTLEKIFEEPELLKQFSDKYHDNVQKYLSSHDKCKLEVEIMGLGISAQYHSTITTIYKQISDVKKNIYKLYFSANLPFSKCEEIGKKLKYDPKHPDRLNAFIDHIYNEWNNQGTLYVTEQVLDGKCRYHGIEINDILLLLHQYDEYYTSMKYHEMEVYIEEFCNTLLDNPRPVNHRILLDDYQCLAVSNALKYNISIITGGPGRGKSYTVGTIIEKLHTFTKVYVLAPTGAAVERLRCESRVNLNDNSVSIQTIHSFVYNNVDGRQINEKRNEPKYSKETNADTIIDIFQMFREVLIIIDEMSMVDLELFHEFATMLEPVIEKIRLVLLGDVDQLPSIRGGNLLHDLIKSDVIPYTRLFVNHRTENPEINENAEYAIRGMTLFPKGNFIVIDADNEKKVQTRLLEILTSYDIRFENSCILVPQRKSGICANSLNPILQSYYNHKEDENPKHMFRAGDKVIQGTNNKDKDIYNGSIMIVSNVEYVHNGEYCRTAKMVCRYYQNECDIGTGVFREITFHRTAKMAHNNPNTVEYNKIDLAYAMTVHKAQGKGYDTVVIVINSNMRYMLNRKLLYTAITRAKNRCIIITDDKGLFECQKEAPERVTDIYQSRRKDADLITGLVTIVDKLKSMGDSCILRDMGLSLDNLDKASSLSIIHNHLIENPDLYQMIRFA